MADAMNTVYGGYVSDEAGFGFAQPEVASPVPPSQPQVPVKTPESLSGKILLLLAVILMCFGMLVVYSGGAGWAARKFDSAEHFLWRQALFTVVGTIVIFVAGGTDYKLLKKVSKVIVFAAIGLLALLILLKTVGLIHGAARWLGYGPFKIQASDMAKYALIIHLANLLSEKQRVIKDLYRGYYPMITIVLIVAALVALEPNFSTAAVLTLISFVMMFIGRVSLKHLAVTMLPVIPVAAGFAIAAPYRMQRLLNFVGKGTEDSSYQINQALIGFGNGGLLGLGIGASKQRELFLPESYNDFIFAIVGEEYGFIGAVMVLLLFIGIFLCGISIAKNSRDLFGKYLAFGVSFAILFYALVNAAVACHLLPTTGLAMPFVSYGGSAAFFNSVGVGLLVSISREKNREEKKRKKDEAKLAAEQNAASEAAMDAAVTP
jgi:cell division protein FtsW